MACLNVWGNIPVERDRLIINVIVRASKWIHFFRREVGIGSKSHCLYGESRTTLIISSVVAGVKLESSSLEWVDRGKWAVELETFGIDDLRLLILSVK